MCRRTLSSERHRHAIIARPGKLGTDLKQDWQPYPVDLYYSAVYVMTIYILSITYIWRFVLKKKDSSPCSLHSCIVLISLG